MMVARETRNGDIVMAGDEDECPGAVMKDMK